MKERRRKGFGDSICIVVSRIVPAERERAFMGGNGGLCACAKWNRQLKKKWVFLDCVWEDVLFVLQPIIFLFRMAHVFSISISSVCYVFLSEFYTHTLQWKFLFSVLLHFRFVCRRDLIVSNRYVLCFTFLLPRENRFFRAELKSRL